jgi:hypothetical protein
MSVQCRILTLFVFAFPRSEERLLPHDQNVHGGRKVIFVDGSKLLAPTMHRLSPAATRPSLEAKRCKRK